MSTDIILAVHDGHPTATSLQIAEHFGKNHRDVLRAVDNLECSPEFSERNFALAEYLDEQGKPRKSYTLTRDGFVFLCMGFTGKEAAAWKERYIAAFNAMEAQLHTIPAPAALPHAITEAQAGELATLIAERFPDGSQRPYAWGRFNNHFRIARYRELPASRFDEARAYIPTMPGKGESLPAPQPIPVPENLRILLTLHPDGLHRAEVITPEQMIFTPGNLNELLGTRGFELARKGEACAHQGCIHRKGATA